MHYCSSFWRAYLRNFQSTWSRVGEGVQKRGVSGCVCAALRFGCPIPNSSAKQICQDVLLRALFANASVRIC